MRRGWGWREEREGRRNGRGGMSRVWIKVKPGTVGTDEKGGQREERGERVEV